MAEKRAIISVTKRLSPTAKNPSDLRNKVAKVLKMSTATTYNKFREHKIRLKKQPSVRVIIG